MTRNGVQMIPYFPGNDFRGRLRRHGADIVLDHITVVSKLKGVGLYAGLTSGSITNSPDTADLSAEEILRARENAYMGLFGGGARILRSRFQVADLIPVLADTIAAGSVPKEYGDEGELSFVPTYHDRTGARKPIEGWQLVSKTTSYRRDDVLTVARPDEIVKYIEDAEEAVLEYQETILGARAVRKADKARVKAGEIREDEQAKQAGLQNIFVIETIATGTPLFCKIDFDNDIRDQHIGLALLALRSLVREQKLGGVVRAGLGQFRANLTLTRDDETFPIFKGDWAAGDADFTDKVLPFIDKASESLKQLSADEMLAFFVPRETKARGKAEAAEVE
ncbi:type IV CRISPR-associated protein Csf2 [Paraburkholderia sp. SIMBA_054]